jgi:hypothetical protein
MLGTMAILPPLSRPYLDLYDRNPSPPNMGYDFYALGHGWSDGELAESDLR